MTRYHSIRASRPLEKEEMNICTNDLEYAIPMFRQPAVLVLFLYFPAELELGTNSTVACDYDLGEGEKSNLRAHRKDSRLCPSLRKVS
jgi:hypothetical protein